MSGGPTVGLHIQVTAIPRSLHCGALDASLSSVRSVPNEHASLHIEHALLQKIIVWQFSADLAGTRRASSSASATRSAPGLATTAARPSHAHPGTSDARAGGGGGVEGVDGGAVGGDNSDAGGSEMGGVGGVVPATAGAAGEAVGAG